MSSTDRPTIFKKTHIARRVAFRKRTAPLAPKNNKEIRVKFNKAEYFVKKHRKQQREVQGLKRMEKKLTRDPTPATNSLALVIRLRGDESIPPHIAKILNQFQLKDLFTAVFVVMDRETTQLLTQIESYVTYGTPDMKTVRDLIYRRGKVEVNGQRMILKSNTLVEENLGKFNLICLEDLVHELFSVGENHKKVLEFLLPFQLVKPSTFEFTVPPKRFREGGYLGDRGPEISSFVSQMN